MMRDGQARTTLRSRALRLLGFSAAPAKATEERLAEIEAAFPFPESELGRLQERTWILDYVPKNGVGAEIGVFRGHFSELICRIAAPRRLYLIDPWSKEGETFGWGGWYTNDGTLPTAVAREEAMLRAQRAGTDEVVLIEEYYPLCADRITEPLDFAYLDAGHTFASTLRELRAIDRQMADGGVILGDDWDPRPEAEHHGVYKALMQFVEATRWSIAAAGAGRQWCLKRTV